MEMDIKIVTGISGAGRSQTLCILEDLGYYCVDNLPPELFLTFIEVAKHANITKIALMADTRGRNFFSELLNVLEKIRKSIGEFTLIFLEANDAVLVRRFKESRRVHPVDGSGILESIQKERQMLEPLRAKANIIIDTSRLSVADLRAQWSKVLSGGTEQNFRLTVASFGFKYGLPIDADLVMDVRFLPNPFYIEELRKLSGQDEKVRQYVLKKPFAGQFLNDYSRLIISLLPYYMAEGKKHLYVAIGCTGGQHRSVSIAIELAALLKKSLDNEYCITTVHRDLVHAGLADQD